MHIEFRHLRTIKAIHDLGGLARAAEQLNITQSALSHQVKGLEEQAGVDPPLISCVRAERRPLICCVRRDATQVQ